MNRLIDIYNIIYLYHHNIICLYHLCLLLFSSVVLLAI